MELQEWKKANDVANILHQPQPNFDFFKKMFRHALLGTTKDGHPVWFMKVVLRSNLCCSFSCVTYRAVKHVRKRTANKSIVFLVHVLENVLTCTAARRL